MPKTVRKIDTLRRGISRARRQGKTIGLVPTMGGLHKGHLALVEECRRKCDVVVVSIFVNPKQFGPGEDLDRYPSDIAGDRRLLGKHGCDIIFAPAESEIYPPGFKTTVGVEDLRNKLCGRVRPGHFDGVTLVVLKLLLAVTPDIAFFGEKDYQQLVIVKQMVRDLALPTEIVAVPLVRDKDGLALSSRNAYLSPRERLIAASLFKSLEMARLLIAGGERRAREVEKRMVSLLVDSGVTKVDYAAVVDPVTLDRVRYIASGVRILVAAWVGDTRLIDNMEIDAAVIGRRRRALRRGTVAVIMAAGEGRRMKSDSPKVLHRVGGKAMVEHVVNAARVGGIKDIIAVVGHRGKKVMPLMKRLGVEVVRQDIQRGTGHAVLQAYPLLSRFSGDVTVLSGDTPLVRGSSVKHILSVHRKHSNTITFATTEVADASGYGRIVRDSRGNFTRIVEEKDGDSRTRAIREINAGLYCFKAEPLFDALLAVTADNLQMEYYLPDVIETIKGRGGRVEALRIADFTEMLGVNTPEELEAVRRIHERRKKAENPERGLENGIHRKRGRR
jgi:pantoate--beta-alanine ligase